jgi:hypothetical protein
MSQSIASRRPSYHSTQYAAVRNHVYQPQLLSFAVVATNNLDPSASYSYRHSVTIAVGILEFVSYRHASHKIVTRGAVAVAV